MRDTETAGGSTMPRPVDWNIRRATLIDVPAVARMIDPPAGADPSVTRLVLAHVGLESGGFWVAADGDTVCAAIVLLPPSQDPAGENTAEIEGVATALEIQLGAAARTLPKLPVVTGIPSRHWFLLAVAEPGAEAALPALVAEALPAMERAGLPVLNVAPGRATQALLAAGFTPWAPGAEIPVLVRPAPTVSGPQTPASSRDELLSGA